MLSIENLIIVIIGCSIAGFVDAAAGGGGLISLPAYLIAGIPPHTALATNKLTSTSGAVVSAFTFFKNGKLTTKLIKFLIPMTILGSIVGVQVIVLIDAKVLQPLIMILILLVGLYTLFSKTFGTENLFDENNLKAKNYIIGMFFAFLLGFYDAVFGPGTGSFLIMFFVLYYKMDFLLASGNAKALNLTSNLCSLIIFAIEGKVNYMAGVFVIPFIMTSTYFGAKFAIKKGIKVIKPIFVTISLLTTLKILIDIIK
ncbi:transporter membrane [Brachyspira pilosicoli P43/6/78]|uniref:Probable membrane transporter protein n=1 Tax=Brachyspira pilosicoli P43/6/78 TaxID=1042417 RepID=A0A3B6VNK8_BRAPL|nr:TSUP family transporter [Brachyspira pilosicoli]AGA66122.1 transporter membrane [Brachyspira pilosicoli P43/6/78]